MAEKLMSFRIDQHLRDEFKLAAAFRRQKMGHVLQKAIVRYVEETLAEMDVKKSNKGRRN